MKITAEFLEKQWSNIKYTDGGFLQIDTQHPLEWHIGYQSLSQRTLLLICDIEIGVVESSKSMILNRYKRDTDNRYALSIELLRSEQQGVFATLCSDIIEYSRTAENETDALALVINRYKQWSKLLESQRSGLMTESRQKGLLGELLFLEEKFDVAESLMVAIQGWTGPNGADQDFIYSDGWFEVKSVTASATSVSVSSLQQLDCTDAGRLVVKRIEKVAPDKPGAFSLNDVVYRISNKLISTDDELALFRSKLSAYGYIDLRAYSEQKYYCIRTHIYNVNETFPKLTVSTVPTQVISTNYELSLPALTEWEVE